MTAVMMPLSSITFKISPNLDALYNRPLIHLDLALQIASAVFLKVILEFSVIRNVLAISVPWHSKGERNGHVMVCELDQALPVLTVGVSACQMKYESASGISST